MQKTERGKLICDGNMELMHIRLKQADIDYIKEKTMSFLKKSNILFKYQC